jgi:hypothetical protein
MFDVCWDAPATLHGPGDHVTPPTVGREEMLFVAVVNVGGSS